MKDFKDGESYDQICILERRDLNLQERLKENEIVTVRNWYNVPGEKSHRLT